MKQRVEVGRVYVDSGQLMICDPCYINGATGWNPDDDFEDIRRYKDKTPGRVGVYQFGKDFGNYEFRLFEEYPHTPNECIKEGAWERIPNPENHNFSYAGACSQTNSKKGHGLLHFTGATHIPDGEGCAAVSETNHGDGCFPVYVHYKEGENRPWKMEVIFG